RQPPAGRAAGSPGLVAPPPSTRSPRSAGSARGGRACTGGGSGASSVSRVPDRRWAAVSTPAVPGSGPVPAAAARHRPAAAGQGAAAVAGPTPATHRAAADVPEVVCRVAAGRGPSGPTAPAPPGRVGHASTDQARGASPGRTARPAGQSAAARGLGGTVSRASLELHRSQGELLQRLVQQAFRFG